MSHCTANSKSNTGLFLRSLREKCEPIERHKLHRTFLTVSSDLIVKAQTFIKRHNGLHQGMTLCPAKSAFKRIDKTIISLA